MKPIRITNANADKINAAIRAAEGRASARTADYDDVLQAVRNAEAHPVLALLRKADHIGAGVIHSVDSRVAKSYARSAYRLQYTRLYLRRRASGWYLFAVERADTAAPGKAARTSVHVDEQHLAAATAALRGTVTVRSAPMEVAA